MCEGNRWDEQKIILKKNGTISRTARSRWILGPTIPLAFTRVDTLTFVPTHVRY